MKPVFTSVYCSETNGWFVGYGRSQWPSLSYRLWIFEAE